MSLIGRLRNTAASAVEDVRDDHGREPGVIGARELPLLDLEAPERVQTATFALG
ncbi:MAG: hypothetical protein ACYC6T_04825 [Thermoleophilia bacterium]